jgi:Family of unknown function (DUF6174)
MKRAVAVVILVVIASVWFGPRLVQTYHISRAESRWRLAAVDDYTWTIQTGCFGPCTNGSPLTIVVRDGRAVRFAPPDSIAAKYSVHTVEDVFDRVRDMVGAGRFDVVYDQAYGYPVSGSFDPSDAFDDEWSFTVNSFVPTIRLGPSRLRGAP